MSVRTGIGTGLQLRAGIGTGLQLRAGIHLQDCGKCQRSRCNAEDVGLGEIRTPAAGLRDATESWAHKGFKV